ncbi:protein serine/threonine kinases [Zea mays]|uniref:non-specific serine/threonine protein kinase n=1 Tax=Zea mays TaxID=4577 RepID=A0A1D6K098_MAIZE|nr:protein serine/threonine kinases [Zea mays]
MVSVSHRNAQMFFDRDIECIYKFFNKRFNLRLVKNEEQAGSENDDEGNSIPSFFVRGKGCWFLGQGTSCQWIYQERASGYGEGRSDVPANLLLITPRKLLKGMIPVQMMRMMRLDSSDEPDCDLTQVIQRRLELFLKSMEQVVAARTDWKFLPRVAMEWLWHRSNLGSRRFPRKFYM